MNVVVYDDMFICLRENAIGFNSHKMALATLQIYFTFALFALKHYHQYLDHE